MQNATARPNRGRTGARSASNPRFSRNHGAQGRSFGGNRSQGRGNNRGRNNRGAQDIHYSRFINKVDTVEKEEVFQARFSYNELPLAEDLKQAIAKKGYTQPSPIQDAVIPHILQGKDVVGIANTGTGKTAAFLIPLIEKVRAHRGEQVLVITPTRELAMQIEDELKSLSKGMRIYSVTCVGGVNIRPQLRALRQRNDFVIGTPGRLKDLVNQHALHLEDMQTIVLDEADRMLDMGFINDMRYLMERMPQKRHTLFFSATMSPEIERVVGDFLCEPEYVSVKTRDTSKNVDQDVVHIAPSEQKIDVLCGHLEQQAYDKVLIFGRTKHGVEKLSKVLTKRGVHAVSIHGNKNNAQRMRALSDFKLGRAQVLVATDVAARGLDIPRVSHVINYDVPTTYDDYVHRIGRTGRANEKGIALTFIGNGKKVAQEGDASDRREARHQDRGRTQGRTARPQGQGSRSTGRPASRPRRDSNNGSGRVVRLA